MSNAVVILGAGSSADFGVPTLGCIFSDAHAHGYLESKPELLKALDTPFWKPRGHELSSCDKSINIEQMLTILKDWEKETSLPPQLRPHNVAGFRRGLYVLIQKAVFEGKSSNGKHLNPLISMCDRLFERVTWASFNWDCIFEASFWYRKPWGLGAGTRSNPSLAITVEGWHSGESRHLFLKLHGGINWWLMNDKITYLQFSSGGPLQAKWQEYDNNPNMKDRPVILEPSFYKYGDDMYRQLKPQWQVFLSSLVEADYVIVVGYSLPEMDVNARSRILTAFQANDRARWLIVDPSEGVCDLYGRLLGQARATILPIRLAEFNTSIDDIFLASFPDLHSPE